jgi:site-specific DNA-adenine methylase
VSLRAPFPWFGGKSRVAHLVWGRFGDVPNYVEPFAGSLAVMLSRPHPAKTETVNDRDAYLANFWRAIQADPLEVALWAGWPVNETDLHARHRWLVGIGPDFFERMRTEPDFYNAKVAGWWAWGICSWIGSGWCLERGDGAPSEQLPHLGNAGMGLHRKLPHLGDAGRGVLLWMLELAERLRRVRVACGDWSRVMGESVTLKHGTTGVFLDPPYSSDEHGIEYASGAADVAQAVRLWALENADNPGLRIALCGYADEHEMPGWTELAWKARGGYGSQGEGRGRENADRERIWFSPHCLTRNLPGPLFAQEEASA